MLIPFRQLAQRYGMKPKGVLHVGAHFGQEAPEYAAIGIQNMVFVEALPHIFEQLRKNMNSYMDALCFNACISDVDNEEVIFRISSNEGQSSSLLEFGVHAVEHPDVTFVDEVKLKTKRLDTLFKDFPLDCDFLNIDLQGAELMALKSMGSMLNDFKWLYIEVIKANVYVGCPLVEEIDEYVAQFGFRRVETTWCGSLRWGDAYFIKS